jgi:hypothetical protein
VESEVQDRLANALAAVLAVLFAAGCGANAPVVPSGSAATPPPSASPVQFPISGLLRMVVTIDPECAGSFPGSRREREYVLSIPADSDADSEVVPSFVDATVYYGSGTILGGGYRPMVMLRYLSPSAVAELDFAEAVSDHELMTFYGTASLSPFLPLPSCGRFDGNVYLNNTALSLEYVCASRNHRVCMRDLG